MERASPNRLNVNSGPEGSAIPSALPAPLIVPVHVRQNRAPIKGVASARIGGGKDRSHRHRASNELATSYFRATPYVALILT